MGPLFFSLAWQSVPESLSHLHFNCWYLDDGVLVLEREELGDILEFITEKERS